jgi:Cysteine rich repeat
MMAHEDKTSTKCDYALYSAARNLDRAIDFIEQAADACWSDIEKLCADVPEGGGRIAQCMITKKSTVNPNCQIVCRRRNTRQLARTGVLAPLISI